MLSPRHTFEDLVNCIRVNHEWKVAFTRTLYEDVITFRSEHARPDGDWDRCEYFIDTNTCIDFARHAHHIRGLTCQHNQLANILLETFKFDSLTEISLILNEGLLSTADETSLDTLSELIARCSCLQAVSIENVDYRSKDLLYRLLNLVGVLEQYPAITCVYFGGPNDPHKLGSVTA